jgi:iron only hydrogenase large subunit-like protein
MGSLVKNHLSGKFGVAANKIFHVTLMPCFDKKLEASRENFKEEGVADVDLVSMSLNFLCQQFTNICRKLQYLSLSSIPNLF